MNDRHVRWLKGEIALWRQEGAVDEATAERLLARYAALPAGVSLGRVILGSLGALLVGLGVIALLAANWEDFSRGLRTVIAFAPLTACVAVFAAGRRRGWQSRAFLEPLGLLWGLAVGAGIALIAQTYNMPGETETFLFTWMALLVPVLYATKALSVTAGYAVGLLWWAAYAQISGGVGLFYWPMIALAAPVVAEARRDRAAPARANLMLWSVALCSTAAVGVTLEKSLPGLWMVIYTGAFSALLLHGARTEDEGDGSIWQRPLGTLGAAGLAVVLYLLIFDWPWENIGWAHVRDEADIHRWAAVFDYALGIVLPAAAAFLLVLTGRKAFGRGVCDAERTSARLVCAWGVAPFVTSAAYVLSSWDEATGASVIMLLYLSGLGLVTLAGGLAQRRLPLVNAGTVVLLAVILGKFFSSDASFTVKGLVFIVCGLCFFAANALFSRRMRQMGGES